MAINQAERVRSLAILLILSLLCVAGPTCAATSPAADGSQSSPASPAAEGNKQPAKKESWWSLMHDPKDGDLDMSRWLLQHKGALLVPIIITEPAVGNGGGIAAVFFHPPSQSQESRDAGERIPPDIYGVAAMKTENGSNAYGLGGTFHFDDDLWRYKGGIGKASFNLDYYTQGQLLAPQKIGYNLDGIFSSQQVSRRLGGSNIYLSARWVYLDIDSRLNIPGNDQFFKSSDFAKVASGVGPLLEYDSRDNTLTPSSGWLSMIEATYYSPTFGGDNTFQSYRTHTLGYLPFGSEWVLGLRADYRAARGDVPFYQLPSIDLRGISYGRYQNLNVAMVEAELRWNFTSRWAALAFTGAGRAWGRNIDFGDAGTESTEGVGIRYLIARQLGMYVGVDSAWGPGEHTYYLQVGSAWR